MKIGLQLYLGGDSARPEFLAPATRAIEERGFHQVWLAEHIVLFPEIRSAYPYSEDGGFPFDPRLLPLEPFTALAFIAAHSTALRLATGVTVLPQRNPVFAAKQIADVDVLSGGRLDVGLGAGWCLEEIEALGVDPARRGARMDAYLDLMKAIWREETIRFDSPFYSLPDSHSGPKPVQDPHPPLFIGGNSRFAHRRVAQHGDGWFAAALDPEGFAGAVAALHEACAKQERAPDSVRLVIGPPGGKADLDDVRRYRDAGAEQVVLALAGRDLERFLARLDRLAETVVVPAQAL